MKIVLAALLAIVCAAVVYAHPGWGIVQDSRGNVYFTDTKQVWKIARDGVVSIVVPNVHTHELSVDSADMIYGEHLWFESGMAQPWKHRVWRLQPDGSVSDVISTRDGFFNDYGFVRDGAGNTYWADRGKVTVIKRRSAAGEVKTYVSGNFPKIERMTALGNGTLFFMEAGSLRRVSPAGRVDTIVVGLTGKGRKPSAVARMNYHMGLWTDPQERVYVAASAEGLILRVDKTGRVTTFARSTAPWAPSGGLIDRDGALWILEYDTSNAVRVRHVDRAGRERIFLPLSR